MIDSLCITLFVSLTVTAIYSNYYLILSAVTSLFGIIGTSMVASVGNSIVTESVEKTTGTCDGSILCICCWRVNNFIGEAWILFKEYFKNSKLGTFFADQALYFGVTVVLAEACIQACDGVGLPCIEVGTNALQAATGAAKVAGSNVVNAASTSAASGVVAADATGIVNGVANSGQSKLFALAGLAARLLLCTVIVAVGYYLAYRWTERYKDAKEWLWSRYRGMRREE